MRTSWLFGWTRKNFVRTMLRLGAERDEVSVVDDQRGSPTYVGHLAAAMRKLLELPYGVWHVAADGDCTWAEFAEAIFEEAGLDCRVRRITTAELGRAGAASGVLGAAQREAGRAAAAALARRPARLSRAAVGRERGRMVPRTDERTRPQQDRSTDRGASAIGEARPCSSGFARSPAHGLTAECRRGTEAVR